MELGCDGVLMNTAIADAKDPIRMARAMKLAVEAGRARLPRGPHGPISVALCRSVQGAPLAGMI
jgi:thiazole synthase